MIANSDPLTCGGRHTRKVREVFYSTVDIEANITEERIWING